MIRDAKESDALLSHISDIDSLIKIQVEDPYTMKSEYMRGLANGLIVAKAGAHNTAGLPDCIDDLLNAPELENNLVGAGTWQGDTA